MSISTSASTLRITVTHTVSSNVLLPQKRPDTQMALTSDSIVNGTMLSSGMHRITSLLTVTMPWPMPSRQHESVNRMSMGMSTAQRTRAKPGRSQMRSMMRLRMVPAHPEERQDSKQMGGVNGVAQSQSHTGIRSQTVTQILSSCSCCMQESYTFLTCTHTFSRSPLHSPLMAPGQQSWLQFL